MLHDVDRSVGELLRRELPASLISQVSISFATPDAQFPPASVILPAVNLFLYEVQENRDLRSVEPDVERTLDGRIVRTPAPIRVDCHYLVTAWAKPNVPKPEEDEHRMLGEAMRVLLRHREIPREALRGALDGLPVPVRSRVTPPSAQQNGGDFWQALGGKPRAAFHFTVTIGVQVHEPEDAGRVVLEVGS